MNIDRYIIRAAKAAGVSPDEIRTGPKSPKITGARREAWAMAYLDGFSLNQIAHANAARGYRGTDHTSIIYGLKRLGVPRRSIGGGRR